MFQITPEQHGKINAWLHNEVYPKVVAEQKKNPNIAPYILEVGGTEFPYEGVIGGGLSYRFTPTSMGDILIVEYQNGPFKFELNVTDFDSW